MSAQVKVPMAFYEAARLMHVLHALTQALLRFSDPCDTQPEALEVIGGLLDAQEETVRTMGGLINAAESELLRQGVDA